MAKRRSFVPECLAASSLEGRAVPSTFGSIGHWFSSQYHHVTNDLGLKAKHSKPASEGILDLWKAGAKAARPAHAHAAPMAHVTANDTVVVK